VEYFYWVDECETIINPVMIEKQFDLYGVGENIAQVLIKNALKDYLEYSSN
jgi:hypothetical protein